MPSINNLTTNVVADTTDFVAGMKRAERTLQDSAKKFESMLSGIDTNFAKLGRTVDNISKPLISAKTLLGGLFASAAASEITSYIGSVVNAVSGLGELSDQLGIDVESLQAYQYAAGQSGVGTDELNAAIAKLSRTIGDAVDGNQDAINLFSKLGIAFKDASGNARSTDDVMRDVAQSISLASSSAQAAGIAYDVFGKSGQKLIPMLQDGAAGMDEWKKKAADLGLVMSRQVVDDFDAAADKWEEWHQRMTVASAKSIEFMLNNLQQNVSTFLYLWGVVFGGGDNTATLKANLSAALQRLQDANNSFANAQATGRTGNTGQRLYPEETYKADVARINDEIDAARKALGLATDRAAGVRPTRAVQTKGDGFVPTLPDPNAIQTRTAAVAAAKDLTSAVDEFNKTQADELDLAKLSNRERQITVSVMQAQTAAQKDYNAGLRDSPLLNQDELQTVKDHASALYDYNDAQKEMLGWSKDVGASIEQNRDATADWQQSAVDANQAIGTAFEDAVIQGEGLRGVLQGLLQDIERIILREAVTKPIEGIVGQGLSWISGLLRGGGGTAGTLSGGGPRGFAEGGKISGPGGPRSDSILAAVSDGEFVVNADATKDHLNLLQALNSGHIQHFADGGLIGGTHMATDTISPANIRDTAAPILNTTINVNASGGTPDQNKDLADKIGKQVIPQLRQMVQGELATQLRGGGMLNRGYSGS